MANTIQINQLATRTWNRLRVNAAEVEWDDAATVQQPAMRAESAPGAHPEPVHLAIADSGAAYQCQPVEAEAAAGSVLTVYETCTAAHPLAVQFRLTVRENAVLRLVQLFRPGVGAMLRHETNAVCESGAKLELITIVLGPGDVYADHCIELNGDGSTLSSQIGYLGQHRQIVDINLTVNHRGKKTESSITAAGALMDEAQKTFRGSIDFKKGSSDSVGSENETVLLLGDGVVNKTVPLILCAEENVDGSHGATIGGLDDDTRFYFESRGIGKAQAEAMMARASVERLIRAAGNDAFAAQAAQALNEELLEEEDGE